MAAAGYSGTPLAKKLGIKPGAEVLLEGGPPNFRQLLDPLPDEVRLVSLISPRTEIIHVFTDRRSDLEKRLRQYRATMNPSAVVWVSWPKKASKLPTDITEDVIRDVALALGFVDIKVAAVDEVWSGLKLMIRRELREKPRRK